MNPYLLHFNLILKHSIFFVVALAILVAGKFILNHEDHSKHSTTPPCETALFLASDICSPKISFADYSEPFDFIPQPEVNMLPWKKGTPREQMLALRSPTLEHKHFYTESYAEKKLSREKLNEISQLYGLPDDLLFYQWQKENQGTCQKTSKKGAAGCFQFLKATAEQFQLIQGKKDYRRNAHASADTAARYLAWLLVLLYGEDAAPDNWEQLRHALAAYNAGHRHVNRDGNLKIPTFTETQRYVFEIEELTRGRAILVNRGETLYQISERTGFSEDALLRANPTFTNNKMLKSNMFVQLPDPETGLSKVLVTRGVTLAKIHSGTGASIESLLETNDLKEGDLLHIGQILMIPPL